MSLADYLSESRIVADMAATTKAEALQSLVDALEISCPGLDRGSVLAALWAREAMGSTGLGDGVAMPHGKLNQCSQALMVVGRSLAGCDFDAIDGAKCHVFCLILTPEGAASGHFRLLARMARIFKSAEFRKRFMAAADAAAIWQLLLTAWRD